MRVLTTIAGLRCYLRQRRADQQLLWSDKGAIAPPFVSVGLVPTMGALHTGHLSLIQRARVENDIVVVSIFVNPLQFGPNEDFHQYPRTLERDRQVCEQAEVDAIFAPAAQELYGSTDPTSHLFTQVIPPSKMMAGLCGRSRPGHFQGVATIVTKLLNLVQPERAYFGQKDAQQVAILRRVVKDLNIPVELAVCPIVREPNGLAMSSRNQYLTVEQKDQASILYQSLQRAAQTLQQGMSHREDLIAAVKAELATVPSLEPEYVELVHPDTMEPLDQVDEVGLLAIAARLGSTRLIDNLLLRNRQPVVAIDGPAGAGKSTVARRVAQTLGLLYLDTGAMYRAVTWLVLKSGIPLEDEAAIAELVSQCEISISGQPSSLSVQVNNKDVTQAIRSLEVTAQVSAIAAQAAVRQELVRQQQAIGRKGGIVLDGRDIGTHVFPDAELKIFLTASVQERARRRQQDLKHQGQPELDLEELERTIYERDRKDSTRSIAPLRKATDAIELQTDNFTADETTAKIISLYYEVLSR